MPYIVREQEAKKLDISTMFGGRNEKAALSQVICSPVSKNMTAGFIRLQLGYTKDFVSPLDEVDLFLEGSLTLTFGDNSFTAQKGDIIFIAKGDKIQFSTDEGCFVFYVTYPLLKETVEALKKSKQ
jgi:ethanolamine utilization protein EutQ (cupin superfamily)